MLEKLEASGLSVHAFARREGVNGQRLYRRWRARAGRRPSPGFVEIVGGTAGGGIERLEFILRSGIVVRVPEDFRSETVRRLVEVLEGRSSSC